MKTHFLRRELSIIFTVYYFLDGILSIYRFKKDRLAYKSSSKSGKRCLVSGLVPCLEARSAIVRARASERASERELDLFPLVEIESSDVILARTFQGAKSSQGVNNYLSAMLFCAQTEEKITPTKPFSNLVPRVSPLSRFLGREEDRPWERGCLFSCFSSSSNISLQCGGPTLNAA